MILRKMYVYLKEKDWSRHLKQKICSIEETRFISRLLNSGYSLHQCLEYLENSKNHDLFEQLRQRLKQGDSLSESFHDFFCHDVSEHFQSFVRFLSLSKALELSVSLYDQKNLSKQKLLKTALSPFVLMILSLSGVQLFCIFVMPSMISMMEGFDVSTFWIQVIFQSLMCISMGLMVLLIVLLVLLIYMTRHRRIVFSVLLLYQLNCGFLVRNELSLRFARLLFQCIELGIPTKTALEMMKSCKNQPLIVFLSYHVQTILEQGGNLEEAMSIRYLDPALQRLIKTAALTGSALELLSGYLIVAERKSEKRIQRFAKSLELFSYVLIGILILLVYQVLFLPLSMLERM